MSKSGNVGGKGRSQSKAARHRQSALALEPRMMFDAAMVATAIAVTQDGNVVAHADTVDDGAHALLDRLSDLGALAEPAAPPSATRTEIVFIDTGIANWQALRDGVAAGTEVVLLDPAQDGLTQMLEALRGRSGIDAIHVLSHGAAGQVQLGALTLDTAAVEDRAADLAALGAVLSADGDLLLYGCTVAGGDGQGFINALSAATGADVAASTNVTGAASRGGDWDLEATSGIIDGAVLSAAALSDFSGTLAAPTLTGLSGDSVTWAGVGSSVTLDLGGNAVIGDAELDALNSTNGNWDGASLTVQRVVSGTNTPLTSDVYGFNTSGASFTDTGSALQSGASTFATYTNTNGVLTISFVGTPTIATTALVQDVLRRVTYRNDTPAGDAVIRFSLSDGTDAVTADVTVTSDSIYVINATDAATIDVSDGVSLSEAVAIAAADATGTQTILFASGLAAGTITLAGNISLAESLTIDADAASGLTITGSTISIASGVTLSLTNGLSDTLTVASTLSGDGALTRTGAGTLTLSGNNTYTGQTNVEAGTLVAGHANALGTTGTGTSVTSGAALQVADAISIAENLTIAGTGVSSGGALVGGAGATVSGTVTLSGNASIGVSTGNSFTISGVISDGSSSFALTKVGAGTLVLSAATNSFDGGLAIAAGTVSAATLGALGTGAITLTGGALTYTGSTGTLANAVNTTANNGTISHTNDLTISGLLSGSGTLTKGGSGKLTLSNTGNEAAMLGNITVTAGTLFITNDDQLSAGTLTLNGGTLASSGTHTIDNALAFGATGGTLAMIGAVTLSGNITGTGKLTKVSGGSLVLSGTNSFQGGAQINAGTLSVAGSGNLGTGTVTLNQTGKLLITGTGTITNAIDAIYDNVGDSNFVTIENANAVTLSGVISGVANSILAKAGAGTLTLSNTGNATGWSGGVIVNAGTLSVAAATNISTGSVTLAGGTLAVTATTTLTNNIALSTDSTINIGSVVTLSGVISGSGALTKTGGSALTLSGNNTYTGATTLSAGVLIATHSNALGTSAGGTTVASGTTLRLGNGITIADALTLSGIGVNAGYGALKVNEGNASATVTGNITLAADTDIGAYVATDTLTLSGNISGSFKLTKVGDGTLALSGTNTLDEISLGDGTLQVGSTGALANGTVGILAGTTLRFSTTGSFTNYFQQSGVGTIDVADGVTATIDALSGNHGFSKTGTGTLSISTGGTPDPGATNIVAGTLRLTDSGFYDGALTVKTGGTLAGSATLYSALTVESGGTLAPGSSPGIITANDAVALNSGSIFAVEIIGGGATAGTNYDQLAAQGSVDITGATLTVSATGVLAVGDVYTIIDKAGSGAITGTFAGLAEGATVTTGGGRFSISYTGGTGNDVDLTYLGTVPTLTNLSGDSVALVAGTPVRLDSGTAAVAGDATLGAMNGGAGDWSGASLSVQRVTGGTADPTANDVFAFDTAGADFVLTAGKLRTVSGDNEFATVTNTGGVLTITFSGSNVATTALVQQALQRITYANDTPYGDATLRVTLSNGTNDVTADVTVTSSTIVVDSTSDDADGDADDGFSLREALARGVTQTGADTIKVVLSNNATITLGSGVTSGAGDTLDLDGANGLTIAGSTLTLGGTLSVGNGTSDTATISTVIAGSNFGLTKTGAGALTLSGTNTHSGAVTVSGGTLTVSGGSAIGDSNAVTVSGDATLALSGNETIGSLAGAGSVTLGSNTLTAGGDNTSTTFSGAIGGTGALTKTGSGTLTLSGANTFTGATTVSAGTLALSGGSSINNTSAVTVSSGATLSLTGGGETIGSLAGAGNVSLSYKLTVGDASNTTFSGIISSTNSSGLEKVGAGTLTLTGANTYTGATTVSAGGLTLNKSGGALSDTTAVTVASGATLTVTTNDTIGSLAGAGTVALGSSLLTFGGNNTSTTFSGTISGSSGGSIKKLGTGILTLSGTNTYVGGTDLAAGTIVAGATGALGTAGVSFSVGTTLDLAASGTYAAYIDLAANATINVGAGISATLSNTIDGTGNNLTKTGAGTLILTGTSNYGATAVSAGTLLIDGQVESSVTVASGATLGGKGSVWIGNVTIDSGGTLAPGSVSTDNDGVGAFTLNDGALTLNGSAAFQLKGSTTAGTDFDQIVVNGNITIGSTATLSVTTLNSYSLGSNTITVIDSGGLTNNSTTLVTGALLDASYLLTMGGGADSNDVTILGNRPPAIDANAGATVAEGGVATIGSDKLSGSDTEGSTASQLVYKVTTAPTKGTLFKDADSDGVVDDGEALALNATFTQNDVNNGQIKYRQDGSEATSDSVGFSLTDKDNITLSGQTFALTITPVNDAPALGGYGNNVSFTENGDGVQINAAAVPSDAEIDGGAFNNGTLTIQRQEGADSQDQFRVSGGLSAMTTGGNLVLNSVTIGSVTQNGAGLLSLSFNSNATTARVQELLRSITYANNSDVPPASVTLVTTLGDGNSGAQGSGGAKTVTATTTIAITAVNDAPTLFSISNTSIGQKAAQAGTAVGTLVLTDPDGDGNASFSISGGNGAGFFSVSGNQLVASSGVLAGTYSLTITANDGGTPANLSPVPFTITVTDDLAPTGYAVSLSDDLVNAAERGSVTIALSGGEVGTTYSYTLTSAGGGSVTGSGSVTSAGQTIAVGDLSGLRDGALSLSLTLTDTAGNKGVEATATSVLDAVAPAGSVTIADALLNAAEAKSVSASVTGVVAGDSYAYTLTSSGGGSISGSGTWSGSSDTLALGDLSGLSDGTLTLTIDQTDRGGNRGAPITATTALDKSMPTGSVTIADALLNAAEAKSVSASVTGVVAGDAYTYTVTSSGGGSVSGSGTWSGSNDTLALGDLSGLADGTLTISIDQTDKAGNKGSPITATAVLDKTLPTGSLSFADALITPGEGDRAALTVTGAETGSKYSYTIVSSAGGTPVSGSGVLSGGAIALPDLAGLNDGTLTVTLTLEDAAGNKSAALTASAVLDLIATPIGLTLDPASDTGVSGDGITTERQPSIQITAAAGVRLAVDWGDGRGFVEAGIAGGGSQTLTLDQRYDAPGAKTIQVRGTDANNIVTLSSALPLTIIPVAPTLGDTGGLVMAEDSAGAELSLPLTSPDIPLSQLSFSVTGANSALIASASIDRSGSTPVLRVTPVANAFGQTSVTLTITGANGISITRDVAVTITPVNDAPVAGTATPATAIQGQPFTYALAVGAFSDVDSLNGGSDRLSYSLSGPGWMTIDPATGNLTGTPAVGDVGTRTVTITATDAGGLSASVTIDLTVIAGNAAPIAGNDGAATTEIAAVVGNLLSNDTDADAGDVLRVTAVNGSASAVGGTVTLASGAKLTVGTDGSYRYDPNGAFGRLNNGQTGRDSFTYTVTDRAGASSTATVTIDVAGLNNDPVTEQPKQVIIARNADAVGLSIDPPTDPDGDPLTITITGLPGNGVTLRGDGSGLSVGDTVTPAELTGLLFDVTAGFVGSAGALTYTISDGSSVRQGSVTLLIAEEQIVGIRTSPGTASVQAEPLGNGVTRYSFEVYRTAGADPATTGSVTIDYQIQGGNGITGADFAGGVLPSGTVTLAAGESSRTVTIDVANDGVTEGDETFSVALNNLRFSDLLLTPRVNDPSSVDATILDRDLDRTPPRVVSVSGPAAGSYFPGDDLTVTLTFSETVTVTGGASLPLLIGAGNRTASYVSGSGTASLTFRYVVAAGDADGDGISIGTQLSGAVRDGAGNAAVSGFVLNDGNARALNLGDVLVNTVRGKSIDGYIQGALVFADANRNGVQDAGEASATTDSAGNYTVSGGSGPLIMVGGRDIATGITFDGIYAAPPRATVINPLTTAIIGVAGLGATDAGFATASGQVKAALGIDAGLDLFNTDPISAATDPSATAATIAAALNAQGEAGKLSNLLVQGSALLTAAATAPLAAGAAGNALAAAIGDAVNALPAGGRIDLSDVSVVQGMLANAATRLGQNAGGSLLSGTAQLIAAANARVETAENGTGTALQRLTEMARVQVVAQGDATLAIRSGVIAGSLDAALAGFTGSALDQAIAQAQVGTVAPARITLVALNASGAETDSGVTSFRFQVTRTGSLFGTSSVDWAVSGDSGLDAADFGGTLPAGTVTFADGESVKTITVQVTGDTRIEADERFTVTLSNAAGADIRTPTVSAVILDNDPTAPTFAGPDSIALLAGISSAVTGIAILDGDSPNLTVTLTPTGGAIGLIGSATVNVTGGVTTVSGTVADVNATLASLVFTPDAGSTGASIRLTASDGDAGTVDLDRTLAVRVAQSPENRLPVQPVVIGGVATEIIGVGIRDTDSPILTVTLTPTGGEVSLRTFGTAAVTRNADGSLRLTGAAADVNASLATIDFTASKTVREAGLRITTDDLDAVTPNDSDMILIQALQVPEVTLPAPTPLLAGGTTAVTGIVIADADSDSLTVTLTPTAASIVLTASGGVAIIDAGGGALRLTGSVAGLNATLAGLRLTASADATSASLRVQVGDNDARTPDADSTLTLPVRAQPTVTLTAGGPVRPGVATAITGISVADRDSTGLSVTLTPTTGALAVGTTTGVTVTQGANGTLTLSGATAAVNSALAGLTTTLPAGTTAAGITVTVTDGVTPAVTRSLDLTVVTNLPPVTGNDLFNVDVGNVLTRPAVTGLLANDRDPDAGDSIRIISVNGQTALVGQIITLATGARVTIQADGSFTIDASGRYADMPAGAAYTETLTYVIADRDGERDSATVSFTILGRNDAPVAGATPITLADARAGFAYSATLPGGLFSDVDAGDKLTLSIAGLPAGLSFDATTGAIGGVADFGDVGSRTLTITATDSQGATATRTVTLTVVQDNVVPPPVPAVETAGTTGIGLAPLPTTPGIDGSAYVQLGALRGFSLHGLSGNPLEPARIEGIEVRTGTPGTISGPEGFVAKGPPAPDGKPYLRTGDANPSGRLVFDPASRTGAYTLPAGTFVSNDGSLTVAAKLPGGKALPAWLRFDPRTGAFTVREAPPPGAPARLVIEVTATNAAGQRETVRLTLRIADGAASLEAPAGKVALSASIRAVSTAAIHSDGLALLNSLSSLPAGPQSNAAA